jgi:pimeloyl-ACP methyl ester carboxylesterase
MKAPMEIAERQGEIAGIDLHWRVAGEAPILYLHGVPAAGWHWEPFLAVTGGIAPDLPGFGRSGKPAEWDYGAEGFAAFLERFLDWRGIERVRVVAHDWGSPALLLGERIERAVAIDVVPLLPGHTWHWVARAWRTPGVGELAMALTSRWSLRRLGGLTPEHAARVMEHFDHGTQRAILRLYRRADVDALARTGERLGALEAPTLVVWGMSDPYLDPAWAERLAARLPRAEVRLVIDGDHWPWDGDPKLITEICDFLESGASFPEGTSH